MQLLLELVGHISCSCGGVAFSFSYYLFFCFICDGRVLALALASAMAEYLPLRRSVFFFFLLSVLGFICDGRVLALAV